MALTVLNPATEEPIAELAHAGVEETDAAVARAHEVLPGWRRVAPTDRARLLRRLATLVEEHDDELAASRSRARASMGSPARSGHVTALAPFALLGLSRPA